MKKFIALLLVVLLSFSTTTVLAAGYSDKDTVKKVQQALNNAGYNCGTPDGIAGKKTFAAIEAYQKDRGLATTGEIDDALLETLGLAAKSDSLPRIFVNSLNKDYATNMTDNYSEILDAEGKTVDDVMSIYGLGIPLVSINDDGTAIAQSSSQKTRLEMKGIAKGSNFDLMNSVSLTFLNMRNQILPFFEIVNLDRFIAWCDTFSGGGIGSESHFNDVMALISFDKEKGYTAEQWYRESEETVMIETEDYKVTYRAFWPNPGEITFTVYYTNTIGYNAEKGVITIGDQNNNEGNQDSEDTDTSQKSEAELLHNPGIWTGNLYDNLKNTLNQQDNVDWLEKQGLTPDTVVSWYDFGAIDTTTNDDGISHVLSSSQRTRFEMTGIINGNTFERVDSVSLTFLNKSEPLIDSVDTLNLYFLLVLSEGLFIEDSSQRNISDVFWDIFVYDENAGGYPTEQWNTFNKEKLVSQMAGYYLTYKYRKSKREITFTVHPGQMPDTGEIVVK